MKKSLMTLVVIAGTMILGAGVVDAAGGRCGRRTVYYYAPAPAATTAQAQPGAGYRTYSYQPGTGYRVYSYQPAPSGFAAPVRARASGFQDAGHKIRGY